MKKFLSVILIVFLLTGGSVDNTNSKAIPSVIFKCETAGEYNIDDDIKIIIYFGTLLNQSDFDLFTINNPDDRYNTEISIINKKSIQSQEEEQSFLKNSQNVEDRIVIATFDDFNAENYPLIIGKKYSLSSCSYINTYDTPSSIEYNIPKSLLLDESGIIIIKFQLITHDFGIIRLKYIISGNNVFINKI